MLKSTILYHPQIIMNTNSSFYKSLIDFLSIDSQTNKINNVNKAGEFVIDYLKNIPIEWERVKKDGSADFFIGRPKVIEQSKPIILLSGHLDVVPKFKRPELKGRKLYTSGVADMKGGVFCFLESVKNLYESGDFKNIIIALNSEEEIASPHHAETIHELSKEADYALVFESTHDTPLTELNSQIRSVVKSRKGAIVWEIKIKGPGGHSGLLDQPKIRHTAIGEGVNLANKLFTLQDFQKGTTLNIGTFDGGEAVNTLPANVEMIGEYRFKNMEELERMRKEIDKIFIELNKSNIFKYEYTEKVFYPPMFETKETSSFIDIVEEITNELGIKLEKEDRAGSSDANHYKYGNQKIAVIDGMGVYGENAHTDREWADIESFDVTIELIENIIKKLLN